MLSCFISLSLSLPRDAQPSSFLFQTLDPWMSTSSKEISVIPAWNSRFLPRYLALTLMLLNLIRTKIVTFSAVNFSPHCYPFIVLLTASWIWLVKSRRWKLIHKVRAWYGCSSWVYDRISLLEFVLTFSCLTLYQDFSLGEITNFLHRWSCVSLPPLSRQLASAQYQLPSSARN